VDRLALFEDAVVEPVVRFQHRRQRRFLLSRWVEPVPVWARRIHLRPLRKAMSCWVTPTGTWPATLMRWERDRGGGGNPVLG
jgi:hypothetical protein